MRRRGLLGAAAALALPAVGRAQRQSTLRVIPQIDLSFLDPHWTTAYVTRNHGYMVFDTLYGMDSTFAPQPQMAAGHVVEDDGRRWTIVLRPGLMFHDGTKVLARDCVASIRRWARRDPFGDTLMGLTDELSAVDDRTIRFRLRRPFPLLPAALGKAPSPMCAIMPERIAASDPFKQITEIIGSGPFRYQADERVQGARNVYRKFEGYVPRPGGVPEWTAGPKLVHFDRVEWTTIPDAGTASAALINGEQDFWEYATHDLLPLLRRSGGLRVTVPDPTGQVDMMRPNQLQPPFNNPKTRQALLWAIDQGDFMQAIVGNDPTMYYQPLGNFCPKTPMASEAGLAPLKGRRDIPRVKEMLKAAGYAGEKIVLMVPSDYVSLKALGDVAADMMDRAGMNVDYAVMDWGSMLQRRNKKEPVEQGGWSAFVTGWAGLDHLNPAGHIALRGNGDSPSAWPGWCVSPRLEELRLAWFDAPDLAAAAAIAAEMQVQAMQDVPYWPLGQYLQPTAFRSDITGVLPGFFTAWNLRRS